MAGITIPGQAGVIESRQQLMAQAVAEQLNIVTATPAPDPNAAAPGSLRRRPMAGDLGRPLQTARLA